MPTAAGDGSPAIETDPTTGIGMVRLLITDVDPDNVLFQDSEIQALLISEGGSRKLAAATALDVIARSEALISKRITTQDLSTDGPAVAKELRASAQALRDQVAAGQDTGEEPTEPGFGIDVAPLYRFDPPPPWANLYL